VKLHPGLRIGRSLPLEALSCADVNRESCTYAIYYMPLRPDASRRPWREMSAAAITLDEGALPDAAAVRALLQVQSAHSAVP
jgi:hypothetical protein